MKSIITLHEKHLNLLHKQILQIIQTWWKTNLGFGKEVIFEWISNVQKFCLGVGLFYELDGDVMLVLGDFCVQSL